MEKSWLLLQYIAHRCLFWYNHNRYIDKETSRYWKEITKAKSRKWRSIHSSQVSLIDMPDYTSTSIAYNEVLNYLVWWLRRTQYATDFFVDVNIFWWISPLVWIEMGCLFPRVASVKVNWFRLYYFSSLIAQKYISFRDHCI